MSRHSFRYNSSGSWHKGNTHIHSTASDGGKTFQELESMYAGAGYDFIFHTDHWVASDIEQVPASSSLIRMDGIELDGKDHGGSHYHVVCLGTFSGITGEMGLVAGMEAARAQGGLLILAHPHWMGNSLEDALRGGFDGVEVYNHVCHWLNGKGDGSVYWNSMLGRFPNTLAFSVDDAHISAAHPGWNGGWIMVNTPERSREAIQKAIRAGHFYSSCGPEIHTIEYDGSHVSVAVSPARFVRLVGPSHAGNRVGSFDGKLITKATLEVPPEWLFAYLEVEDAQGRLARTNPLFVTEA
ncbi:MAG: hypothetical protein V1800_00975 [Candidatus Latescibacterota bacterium]